MTHKKVLITGIAGFIGYHTAKLFVKNGYEVIGIDNLNDYYDIKLKFDRINDLGINDKLISFNEKKISTKFKSLSFIKLDITDNINLRVLFEKEKFDFVIHLAAQAGVRNSIENPNEYISSNINGFIQILENVRRYPVKHLIYASSSSVYGQSDKNIFSINDRTDEPVSLYAATKKSNELMAYSYSHLFKIKCTGLRFFTVYGPWGRPDMAPILFANAISQSKTIQIFNYGNLYRDFTYIDDIVKGIFKIIDKKHIRDKQDKLYKLFNIGASHPIKLMDFIDLIEKNLGAHAKKEFLPMQDGDVYKTFADVTNLKNEIDYVPTTNLES